MIDKNETRLYLKRIKSSKDFCHSETSKKLLDYLVERSIEGEVPREIDIAIDFFNRDPSYDPSSDSLIRSHIFSLRKKLETYYLTEGIHDRLRLMIPKGHYEVVFVNTPRGKIDHNVKRFRLISYSLSFLLSLFLIWSIINNLEKEEIYNGLTSISAENPIWQDFINSDKPTLFVLGDYFIFWQKSKWTSGDRKIRDGAINSFDDLEKFKKENPDKADLISTNTGSYYSPPIVEGLAKILPFFTLNKITYKIKSAQALTPQDVEDHNIIFIGPYKTLNILNEVIEKLRLKYQIYPHKIILDNDQTMDYVNVQLPDQSSYYRDYVLIAKVPGPKDNIILIMAMFGPGNAASKINPIFQDEEIDVISTNYLEKSDSFPQFFEALYESNDVRGAVTSTLTHFYPIAKTEYLSKPIP